MEYKEGVLLLEMIRYNRVSDMSDNNTNIHIRDVTI